MGEAGTNWTCHKFSEASLEPVRNGADAAASE